MEKPIIAVLGGHHSAGHDQYDCVDHVYCERIVEAGALPILLPAAAAPDGKSVGQHPLRLAATCRCTNATAAQVRYHPLPQATV